MTTTAAFELRRTDFHGVVEDHLTLLKWYSMTATGEPVTADQMRAAQDQALKALTMAHSTGRSIGFAILHLGEEADWLQICWWRTDILHTRLLTRPVETSTLFDEPTDVSLRACVWELHVIDFERRAWAAHVLANGDVGNYLRAGIQIPAGATLRPSSRRHGSTNRARVST